MNAMNTRKAPHMKGAPAQEDGIASCECSSPKSSTPVMDYSIIAVLWWDSASGCTCLCLSKEVQSMKIPTRSHSEAAEQKKAACIGQQPVHCLSGLNQTSTAESLPGKNGRGESVRLNMENTVAKRMGPKPVPSDRAPNSAPCIAP